MSWLALALELEHGEDDNVSRCDKRVQSMRVQAERVDSTAAGCILILTLFRIINPENGASYVVSRTDVRIGRAFTLTLSFPGYKLFAVSTRRKIEIGFD